VLTGAGDKAFVAGTDINEFKNFTTPEDSLRYEARMDGILTALERLSVPTIAALRGACTGGGAALASACDLRIGTPSLRFGFPVARTLGNCLSVKNYARLVALTGEGAVKQMLYTAELMGAERAYQLGLLNALVAEDALESEAEALADRIAGNAPLTIRVTKEALRRIREHGASAEDTDLIQTCYQSDDFREGMTAFLAKRPAKWSGR
jgi:enoyl-CoA hydratase/carnithine racemase